MKSMIKAFSSIALSGAMVVPALAGTEAPATAKDMKAALENQGINYVQTAQKGITLSGYVDTSYTMQFAGKGQPFAQTGGTLRTLPPTAGQNQTLNGNNTANLRQFDTNANGFNVNAVKLALEKALPDKNDWAAGFRIDLMAGSDAKALTATDPTLGNAGSSLYVEQALVKFRVPVGNGLDIYMGKFVTFLGYEVIESPANLNFSRGLLFTNAIPLTNTGVYADYKWNDIVETKFGIVDGWNNSSSDVYNAGGGNQYAFGGKAITGQITITNPSKNANITQSFIFSPNSNESQVNAGLTGDTVVYDIWGNWNPTFVKDNALLLGFNGDFGYTSQTNAATLVTPTAQSNSQIWYGVALYSQYKFTKVFSLAGRLEWLAQNTAGGATTVRKFNSANGGTTDDFSATITANFNLWENLLTRVEYRHDFLDGVIGASGNNISGQDEISVNAVYSF